MYTSLRGIIVHFKTGVSMIDEECSDYILAPAGIW